ncbi:MAG: amidase family protein [Pseudomonadota bacterium]
MRERIIGAVEVDRTKDADDTVPDAREMASRVHSGALSARDAVAASIARIERLNSDLNAVVSERFDKALAEADALDRDPSRKAELPFAGVPFLVKDLEALSGEAHSYGSRLFRDYVTRSTEPVVQVALDAGMIALGKSNTPEFGLIGTTEPLLHGPTRNPWDPTMSPGGSSGGSAAAVASGMVPIAQGGDGGGSIRIPASACGLFGLKTSRGRGLPPAVDTLGNLSVKFFLSRTVGDTAAMLDLCERARVAQAADGPAAFGHVTAAPLRPLRIAVAPRSPTGTDPEPAVASAVAEAVALCQDLGHHVEEAAPDIAGPDAVRFFLAFWAGTAHQIVSRYALLRAYAYRWRPWRWESRDVALDPWTRGLADWFLRERYQNPSLLSQARGYFLTAAWTYAQFFERYDVLLSPVTRRAHVPIGEFAPTVPFETLLEHSLDNFSYTPLHNAIGVPAMSVPLCSDQAGRPIGVQFASQKDDEPLLLQLAYQLEQARPWADRRPQINAFDG